MKCAALLPLSDPFLQTPARNPPPSSSPPREVPDLSSRCSWAVFVWSSDFVQHFHPQSPRGVPSSSAPCPQGSVRVRWSWAQGSLSLQILLDCSSNLPPLLTVRGPRHRYPRLTLPLPWARSLLSVPQGFLGWGLPGALKRLHHTSTVRRTRLWPILLLHRRAGSDWGGFFALFVPLFENHHSEKKFQTEQPLLCTNLRLPLQSCSTSGSH